MNDIEQLARLEIAQHCKTDLFYLCKYILGYDKMTEATHGELCRIAQSLAPNQVLQTTPPSHPHDPVRREKYEISPTTDVDNIKNTPDTPEKKLEHDVTSSEFDPAKNFFLLLMPRGTFKSSVVTIGLSIQFILNDPDIRILIDSETFGKSKAFLAEIKGHLQENQKLREVYSTLYGSYPDSRRKDDLWKDSELNISARKRPRKEPTLSCAGVDIPKTGMHYDLIVGDDWHSERNVTNKDQIEQVVDHYKLALSLIDPGKPLIIIGTRWDYNDVYQHIIDHSAKYFNIFIKRAYNDDGSLFFPEVLTEDALDLRRQEQGSYIFSCQYMNNPVDNETATFKRSQIVRIGWEEVKDRPFNWYLSVDPSYEGVYSDYAAFVLVGVDHMGDLYVRHILRQKMTYADIITNMFDLYTRFNPRQILLETVATQKSIVYELNNEQKRRGGWLPVTIISSRQKSKEERIRGLAPKYEYGRIFHIKECPQLEEFEYELLHFPKGQHDDIIDALASVLEYAKPALGGVASSEKKEKVRSLARILDKPRSPITGV